MFYPYTKIIYSLVMGEWMNFPHPQVVERLWELFAKVADAYDPTKVIIYDVGDTAESIIASAK